jgi:hypothetical protein
LEPGSIFGEALAGFVELAEELEFVGFELGGLGVGLGAELGQAGFEGADAAEHVADADGGGAPREVAASGEHVGFRRGLFRAQAIGLVAKGPEDGDGESDDQERQEEEEQGFTEGEGPGLGLVVMVVRMH